MEKLREQERIRSGKEMAAAKRQEEDLRLKRNLELRRIEKEEEDRARARIRAKLGEWGCTSVPFCSQLQMSQVMSGPPSRESRAGLGGPRLRQDWTALWWHMKVHRAF